MSPSLPPVRSLPVNFQPMSPELNTHPPVTTTRGLLPIPNHNILVNTPTPIQPKPLYFSKWSRKYIENALNNMEAISIYVENLSTRWLPTDIHLFLSKYGNILDVFLPNKPTKSGIKFGFVRFCNPGNINHIVDNINKTPVENGKEFRLQRARAFM
ncbi:hypothetical protein Tsubulata_032280 [Turnera subulata]|uniref:RRM domain-containing protein n=1 Tax=Turnera subulata TaxID=218843 RepID=A0A9Q0FYK7_9ROSI|nr:hypothetical protein Tsubulata_032280 [Turnera subulata]